MGERTLDRVLFRDLTCRCILGINPEERLKEQEVCINITLYADLRAAGSSDRIEDTLDYKQVKKNVLALTEKSSFYLIERLAQAIADLCLAEPLVERVEVTIDKPHALRFARSVAVAITRERAPNA